MTKPGQPSVYAPVVAILFLTSSTGLWFGKYQGWRTPLVMPAEQTGGRIFLSYSPVNNLPFGVREVPAPTFEFPARNAKLLIFLGWVFFRKNSLIFPDIGEAAYWTAPRG
ncbi:MAG: hypothetical protein AB7F09_09675 [Parvibaculaceae bacterium]